MLGLMTNDLEVGNYALGKQIVTRLPHISYAIAMGTMPIFAKIDSSNKAQRKKIFIRLLKTNALIFTPIILGIIFLSGFLVPLIYGEAYIDAILPLQILSLYVLIFTFAVFFNQLLDYQGLAKLRAINLIISMFLNIGLNYYLIPIYGAVGAAISTSIAYLPYFVLNFIEVRKVLLNDETS